MDIYQHWNLWTETFMNMAVWEHNQRKRLLLTIYKQIQTFATPKQSSDKKYKKSFMNIEYGVLRTRHFSNIGIYDHKHLWTWTLNIYQHGYFRTWKLENMDICEHWLLRTWTLENRKILNTNIYEPGPLWIRTFMKMNNEHLRT